MIDSFLDENDWTYSRRELAREIEEHPSTVYRALQRCIEGDDLDSPTVVLIHGMGYCHKKHAASQRKRMSQLPAFRQIIQEEGATTKREDRLGTRTERNLERAEAQIMEFPRLYLFLQRHRDSPILHSILQKGGLDVETPEALFRSLTANVPSTEEGREAIRRGWRIFKRWRRKPEG